MNEDKAKLIDLMYQYTMLAQHVEDFLTNIKNQVQYDYVTYNVIDSDLEPMIRRLRVIKQIQDKNM